MSKQITVEVTADDIRQGWRGGCFNCPIVFALRRQAPGDWSVGSSGLARFYSSPRMSVSLYRVQLPNEACQFIKRFDYHNPVEPFSFELSVPE